LSKVAIVFTGGTISMQPDPVAGGNRPVLRGAEILARSPAVAEIAETEAIDWGLVPASHLRFAQILDIARVVQSQLERAEIDGVVVVQGTDVIEETAFAFDLLLRGDKPVVVTGAMRDAASDEYDGPRNLADAVRAAATGPRGRGVAVAMGELIIPAEDAVKSHATALDAFRARVPIATRRRGPVPFPANPVEDVHLVTAVVGMDGALVRGIAPLRPRGLVIAATGSGNTSADLLAAAKELMSAGTLVALSTRAAGGAVSPIYAFPGGGATWKQAGALMSALDGPKTRVALALGLAAGMDRDAIAELIA
jgi:L-asparaginase